MTSRIQRLGRPPMRTSTLVGIIIATGILLGVLVPLTLATAQQYLLVTALKRHPAPGSRVDVGGYALHLDCRGQPVPDGLTVVIDTHSGSSSLEWSGVARELSKTFRVCTYDRAGYGWSDAGPASRDAEQAVANLRALLTEAEEAAPFLLVGHGVGGVHVRLYAARYPEDVAGLVLVAPLGDEVHSERFEREMETTIAFYERMRFLTTSGLLRLIGPVTGESAATGREEALPDDIRQAYRALLLDPRHYQTTVDELQSVRLSAAAADKALRGDAPLEGMPLVVLTPARAPRPSAGLYSPDLVVTDAETTRAQGELANLSLRGERRMLGRSGPLVHLDAPDSILAAVRDVAALAKIPLP